MSEIYCKMQIINTNTKPRKYYEHAAMETTNVTMASSCNHHGRSKECLFNCLEQFQHFKELKDMLFLHVNPKTIREVHKSCSDSPQRARKG